MATCKKCNKEIVSLQESEEYCPACKAPKQEFDTDKIQNKHLKIKQKRFTSE